MKYLLIMLLSLFLVACDNTDYNYTAKIAVFYTVNEIDTLTFKSIYPITIRSEEGSNYIWIGSTECYPRFSTTSNIKVIEYTKLKISE